MKLLGTSASNLTNKAAIYDEIYRTTSSMSSAYDKKPYITASSTLSSLEIQKSGGHVIRMNDKTYIYYGGTGTDLSYQIYESIGETCTWIAGTPLASDWVEYKTSSTSGTFDYYVQQFHVDPKEALKLEMRKRVRSGFAVQTPSKTRRLLEQKVEVQEQIARAALRDMLSEADWRRYVTNGYVLVKGASGRWYQVFNRQQQGVKVYSKGVMTHSICIHTDASCPPTDHVVNMKLLIEMDEAAVWRNGNATHYQTPSGKSGKSNLLVASRDSLVDTYRALKGAVLVA